MDKISPPTGQKFSAAVIAKLRQSPTAKLQLGPTTCAVISRFEEVASPLAPSPISHVAEKLISCRR
ncbi:MAG: hypothetical protein DMF03_10220 [Verrucomicrobia bacterium]|nr:MAG: hypothetical protein DMF03_10220 [Verrucomicrobiota bacterium]